MAVPLARKAALRGVDLDRADLRGARHRVGTGAVVELGKRILAADRVVRVQAAADARASRQRVRILAIVVYKAHLSPGAAGIEAGCKVESMGDCQGRKVVQSAGILRQDRLA